MIYNEQETLTAIWKKKGRRKKQNPKISKRPLQEQYRQEIEIELNKQFSFCRELLRYHLIPLVSL